MQPDTPDTTDPRPITIDVHAHIVTPNVGEDDNAWSWMGHPLRRTPAGTLETTDGARASGFRLAYEGSEEGVDVRVREMDELGIDMQVLSLLPSLWVYGDGDHDSQGAARRTNDALASIVGRHPRRFRAFAHLPLDRPTEAIAELQRAMQLPGVVGAAVGTNVAGHSWDDPELFGVLEAAEALGALVFFHPMRVRFPPPDGRRYHLGNLIGNPSETTLAVGHLIFGGVVDRLPGLKLVFAHGGGYACFAIGRFDHGHGERPEAREHITELPSTYLRRMYFDNVLHDDRATRYVLDAAGSDHIVLGTDYPADMGPANPVTSVLASDAYTPDEKRDVLGKTMLGLLGLTAHEVGPGR